ncbi:hypothetical protein Aperf_G00000042473 [Anoplocephala perfoliata]
MFGSCPSQQRSSSAPRVNECNFLSALAPSVFEVSGSLSVSVLVSTATMSSTSISRTTDIQHGFLVAKEVTKAVLRKNKYLIVKTLLEAPLIDSHTKPVDVLSEDIISEENLGAVVMMESPTADPQVSDSLLPPPPPSSPPPPQSVADVESKAFLSSHFVLGNKLEHSLEQRSPSLLMIAQTQVDHIFTDCQCQTMPIANVSAVEEEGFVEENISTSARADHEAILSKTKDTGALSVEPAEKHEGVSFTDITLSMESQDYLALIRRKPSQIEEEWSNSLKPDVPTSIFGKSLPQINGVATMTSIEVHSAAEKNRVEEEANRLQATDRLSILMTEVFMSVVTVSTQTHTEYRVSEKAFDDRKSRDHSSSEQEENEPFKRDESTSTGAPQACASNQFKQASSQSESTHQRYTSIITGESIKGPDSHDCSSKSQSLERKGSHDERKSIPMEHMCERCRAICGNIGFFVIGEKTSHSTQTRRVEVLSREFEKLSTAITPPSQHGVDKGNGKASTSTIKHREVSLTSDKPGIELTKSVKTQNTGVMASVSKKYHKEECLLSGPRNFESGDYMAILRSSRVPFASDNSNENQLAEFSLGIPSDEIEKTRRSPVRSGLLSDLPFRSQTQINDTAAMTSIEIHPSTEDKQFSYMNSTLMARVSKSVVAIATQTYDRSRSVEISFDDGGIAAENEETRSLKQVINDMVVMEASQIVASNIPDQRISLDIKAEHLRSAAMMTDKNVKQFEGHEKYSKMNSLSVMKGDIEVQHMCIRCRGTCKSLKTSEDREKTSCSVQTRISVKVLSSEFEQLSSRKISTLKSNAIEIEGETSPKIHALLINPGEERLGPYRKLITSGTMSARLIPQMKDDKSLPCKIDNFERKELISAAHQADIQTPIRRTSLPWPEIQTHKHQPVLPDHALQSSGSSTHVIFESENADFESGNSVEMIDKEIQSVNLVSHAFSQTSYSLLPVITLLPDNFIEAATSEDANTAQVATVNLTTSATMPQYQVLTPPLRDHSAVRIEAVSLVDAVTQHAIAGVISSPNPVASMETLLDRSSQLNVRDTFASLLPLNDHQDDGHTSTGIMTTSQLNDKSPSGVLEVGRESLSTRDMPDDLFIFQDRLANRPQIERSIIQARLKSADRDDQKALSGVKNDLEDLKQDIGVSCSILSADSPSLIGNQLPKQDQSICTEPARTHDIGTLAIMLEKHHDDLPSFNASGNFESEDYLAILRPVKSPHSSVGQYANKSENITEKITPQKTNLAYISVQTKVTDDIQPQHQDGERSEIKIFRESLGDEFSPIDEEARNDLIRSGLSSSIFVIPQTQFNDIATMTSLETPFAVENRQHEKEFDRDLLSRTVILARISKSTTSIATQAYDVIHKSCISSENEDSCENVSIGSIQEVVVSEQNESSQLKSSDHSWITAMHRGVSTTYNVPSMNVSPGTLGGHFYRAKHTKAHASTYVQRPSSVHGKSISYPKGLSAEGSQYEQRDNYAHLTLPETSEQSYKGENNEEDSVSGKDSGTSGSSSISTTSSKAHLFNIQETTASTSSMTREVQTLINMQNSAFAIKALDSLSCGEIQSVGQQSASRISDEISIPGEEKCNLHVWELLPAASSGETLVTEDSSDYLIFGLRSVDKYTQTKGSDESEFEVEDFRRESDSKEKNLAEKEMVVAEHDASTGNQEQESVWSQPIILHSSTQTRTTIISGKESSLSQVEASHYAALLRSSRVPEENFDLIPGNITEIARVPVIPCRLEHPMTGKDQSIQWAISVVDMIGGCISRVTNEELSECTYFLMKEIQQRLSYQGDYDILPHKQVFDQSSQTTSHLHLPEQERMESILKEDKFSQVEDVPVNSKYSKEERELWCQELVEIEKEIHQIDAKLHETTDLESQCVLEKSLGGS